MINLIHLTNLGSVIPWGLWVCLYLYLVGISAGCFALIAWGNLKDNPHLKKITRMGLIISLATLLAGLLSIQIDLGHIERFYKLFITPSPVSVMAWMVWLYTLYFVLLVVALINLKRQFPRALLQTAALFGLGLIVLESLLFALPPGKPWHSLIFPVSFLVSSLVSAIAALICLTAALRPPAEKAGLLKGLGRIALPVMAAYLVLEAIDLFVAGGNGTHPGPALIPVLGSVAAIVLLSLNNPAVVGLAGLIGLVLPAVSKYHTLISGQSIEPFRGFSRAYVEPQFSFAYAPNLFEVLVSLALLALAAGVFYFLYKIYPLTREE